MAQMTNTQTAILTNSLMNGKLTLTFEEDGWISFKFGYHVLCFNSSQCHPDYLDIRDPCHNDCPSVGRWDNEIWQPVFHPYFNPFIRSTPWEQWCVSCLREVNIDGTNYILEDYMHESGRVYLGTKEQYLKNEEIYWGQYTVDEQTNKITMTCKIVHEIDVDQVDSESNLSSNAEITEEDSVSSLETETSSSVIIQPTDRLDRPKRVMTWYDNLNKCDKFYQTHRKIPSCYSKNKEEKSLGMWISNQRNYYQKRDRCLTQERIQACEACDWWVWDLKQTVSGRISPIIAPFRNEGSDMSLDHE